MNASDATKHRQPEGEGQRVEGCVMQQQTLAQVGKWEWNLLARRYTWCAEMYRIFNLSPQASPLRTGSFFNCVHPKDRERVVKAFGQALVGQQPLRIEHRIIRPDGTVRLVRGEAEVSFDQHGRPLSMSGTIRDITGFLQPE
jgi:PAS domain-containing protein